MRIVDFFKDDLITVDWERIEMEKDFADMKTCMQSNVWHKEGSVWNHTKLVTEEMCRRLSENGVNDVNHYQLMVVSAICHDLGKVPTTYWDYKKQDFATENHGRVGDKIARRILFEEDVKKREFICWMVRWHMDFHHLLMKDEDKIKRCLIRMSYSHATVEDMLLLNLCDSIGSINDEENKEMLDNRYDRIKAYAESLDCLDKSYNFNSWNGKYRFFNLKEEILSEDIVNDECEEHGFKVYVMLGLPGAGKSTYVSSLGDDIEVISRDNIRTEMGLVGEKPMGNRSQEDKVTDIFNKKFVECLENGRSCVLDNTNLNRKYRDAYTKMMIPFRPEIVYVYVEPKTIDECKKRREGMMPLDVIDRMFNYMEFPTLEECDELIIIKETY